MNEHILKKTKLIFLITSFVFFFAFIFFSYLVAKEKLTQIDFNMTVRFQDHIPHKVDWPFSLLSVIGSAEISMVLWGIVSLFLLIKKFWWSALSMLLLPIALATEVFGKLFVFHPGPPFMFYRGTIDFNFSEYYVKTNYSYPSGHMLRTSFLATFLVLFIFYRLHKRPQLPILSLGCAIGFIIIMSISRIYLGEHWTSDVIGGTLLGISTGLTAGITVPVKERLP